MEPQQCHSCHTGMVRAVLCQRGGEFDSLWTGVGAEAVGTVLKETKDKKLLLYFRQLMNENVD